MLRHAFSVGKIGVKTLSMTSRGMAGFSLATPRSLDEIAKVSLLEAEESHKIKEIWATYHEDASKNAIAITMDPREHDSLLERVKSCPQFIFPVFASKDAYYLMFSQFQDSIFFLTYLDDYRNNPDTAQPYMTVNLFQDLKESKSLVLGRADHLPNLQRHEAEALLAAVTGSYLDEGTFSSHIRTFNQAPEKFDFQAAVDTMFSKFGSPPPA